MSFEDAKRNVEGSMLSMAKSTEMPMNTMSYTEAYQRDKYGEPMQVNKKTLAKRRAKKKQAKKQRAKQRRR